MRLRASSIVGAVLAVCLLLVQHGAAMHAFVHGRTAIAGQVRVGEDAGVHETVCEVCLAYAALAAAPSAPAAAHPSPPAQAAVAVPVVAPRPAAVVVYGARAPPPFV